MSTVRLTRLPDRSVRTLTRVTVGKSEPALIFGLPITMGLGVAIAVQDSGAPPTEATPYTLTRVEVAP